jgi:hypothetical protein
MKTRYAIAGIALIALICCFSYPIAAQEANKRVIKKLADGANPPVAITDIRVNGQNVSFDKEFLAGDDWMLTLTFTVQNKSRKRILFANVNLFFKHPPGSKQPMALFDLISYGNYALTNRPQKPGEPTIGLAPGESVDIGFSAQSFVDLKRFLSDLGFSPSVKQVEFRLGSIIFDDETMWNTGSWLRRDPSEPSRWNVVDTRP